MLMQPPKGRHWYGGKLVTGPVEIPDSEAESFKRYGWAEVKPKKTKKPVKAKGDTL